jgi:probable rRNA maturation factor
MNDISIPIYVESRYKVDRKRIKERVAYTLKKHNFMRPVEVSIAIVGDRKMRALNKKYRNMDKTTNVLSFAQAEGEYSPQPEGRSYLGDVVISYPVVIDEASRYKKMVDEWVSELVEHGVTHLLGIHHK